MQAAAAHQKTAVHWQIRLGVVLAMGLLVCVPYFWLERHIAFPALQIPASTIDHSLPFVASAGWLYLSLYLLLCLPIVLVREASQLRRMAFGFASIAVVSHVIFFFWPTTVPSFSFTTSNLALRLITMADTFGNALPSLHASLAVYCALCSAVLLRRSILRVGVWTWTFLIVVSALLARRHELIDIAAGAALGSFVWWALFRRQPEEPLECEAWQTTVQARKVLARGIESELAPLILTDWRKRIVEFVCFLALAAAGLGLNISGINASRWPLRVAGILVSALALNAFVLLMHDGMHHTLFRNRRWNWFASVLLGSTFLMSFTAYRIMHSRHHRFLGDPRDPDDYQNYVNHRLLLWSLHFVRLMVGSLLYLILIPLLALKYGSDKERRLILIEYSFLLAVYSALLRAVPVGTLFFVWLLPLLIVGSLTAARGFTQHGITDAADPYLASRTVLPHPVVGFLLLHENYHLEHHLFPEVPSYHLPRLHRLIWQKLPRAVSSPGYLNFLYRFLRATPHMDESPIGLEHPGQRSA